MIPGTGLISGGQCESVNWYMKRVPVVLDTTRGGRKRERERLRDRAHTPTESADEEQSDTRVHQEQVER